MKSFVEEEETERPGQNADTEITLGMKSLLGVFFGAVLVCGVFFGFGYSLGRTTVHPDAAPTHSTLAIAVKSGTGPGSAPAAAESASVAAGPEVQTVVSDEAATSASGDTTAPAKRTVDTQYEYVPTPEGPARRPVGTPDKPPLKPSPALASAVPPTPSAYTKPAASLVPDSGPQAVPSPSTRPSAEQASLPSTRTVPAASSPYTAVAASARPIAGSTMVQIAAVTRQEDAGILVTALKKRGYAVVVRNEPKDSLLHVQVGPFSSREEARAMRARLLGDGYNAILK